MFQFLKNRRANYTVSAVICIIVGLVLVIWPGTSTQVVCKVLGAVLMLYGVLQILMYVLAKERSLYSQGMLVLGVIVVLGLGVHLVHFWSKMMLVELMGAEGSMVGGEFIHATDGAALIAFTFSKWYNVVIYIVWLAALWFHLNHGVWSMVQTVGWANDTWYPRLKCIAKIVSTLIVLGFMAVVVAFFVCSLCGDCSAAAACTEACHSCAGCGAH